MKLYKFIVENIEVIMQESENFAKTLFLSISKKKDKKMLRNHTKEILLDIVEDLQSHQTEAEQEEKSKGGNIKISHDETNADEHGVARWEEGLDINEMVSEFRALRASVTKLFIEKSVENNEFLNFKDLIRFNESIDQVVNEAIYSYMAALEQQQRRFEVMLSHTPDLNYVLDLEGRFIYVNRTMEELYKMPAQKILGTTLYNVAMPSAAEVMRQIQNIINTKENYREEMSYKTATGIVFFEYILAPVLDAKGEVEAISGISIDINERKYREGKIWELAKREGILQSNNKF